MNAAEPSRFALAKPVAESVARQAVDWFVRLHADDVSPETRRRWDAWMRTDPEHARAWEHLRQCAGDVAGLPSPLAKAALSGAAGAGRRRFMKSAAMLAATAGAAYWATQAEPWQPLLADASTGVGQQRRLSQPDGSQVLLNTDSAIDIAIGDQRRIRLARGELLLDAVRKEDSLSAALPFIVQTRHGEVETLGSRLAVRLDGARSLAYALTGPLRVTPADAPRAGRGLPTGQAAAFTAFAVDAPAAIPDSALGWSDGVLAVHDLRLDLFLAELSRYRRGVIRCDPRVADLRVSGVYPLGDTDKVLETLALTLPLRLSSMTRYWVTLGPRERSA
jgi:transmembrane sensor